jgi:hypothetical protein
VTSTSASEPVARRLWRVYEPIHAVVYFAPETAGAYKRLGLKGGWMGYFASRAAPLGPAPAGLVTAVFYNFHPAMVARAIPDAWEYATPADVLTARLEATGEALHRLLPDAAGSADVAEAADLAREAAEAAPMAGRPLYGALRSVPWPSEPLPALWHATTLLREHRGDGHVAALTAAGLDGCEAHVSLAALGAVPREVLQQNRKWSDEEWEAAATRLQERGWLNPDGTATEAGIAGRAALEATTDELAAAPWQALGTERTERLQELLVPLARAVVSGEGVPMPNPVGVPPV